MKLNLSFSLRSNLSHTRRSLEFQGRSTAHADAKGAMTSFSSIEWLRGNFALRRVEVGWRGWGVEGMFKSVLRGMMNDFDFRRFSSHSLDVTDIPPPAEFFHPSTLSPTHHHNNSCLSPHVNLSNQAPKTQFFIRNSKVFAIEKRLGEIESNFRNFTFISPLHHWNCMSRSMKAIFLHDLWFLFLSLRFSGIWLHHDFECDIA
jgi:hypothetical protein